MKLIRVGLLFIVASCAQQPNGTTDAGPVAAPPTNDAGQPIGIADLTGYGDSAYAPDPANPFFVSLGTNDRSCATCHDVATGWSITPAGLKARFTASQGLDPIFRVVDGATSPAANVSSFTSMQTAYEVLLARGLLRIGKPIPAGADFTLAAVNDPYNYASATELSLYRRPLPSTNLRFQPTIMWDGREPSLAEQSMDATLGHAQAMQTETDAMDEIVAFESEVYTAQIFDNGAGDLTGLAGPARLVTQPYTPGVTGPSNLFGSWGNATPQRRAAIARGEQLFDTHRFRITGVAGIADQQVSCSTCHSVPNIGASATGLMLDLGLSDAQRRSADVPLYTFKSSTGATKQSSDPGMALVTGKFADLGRFKVPALRGAVMRPPYFHNGFAADLAAVVQFYDDRFDLHLDGNDKADLVAFLEAL